MLKKILGLVAATALAGTGLVVATESPAAAQRVANPGAGQLFFDEGTMSIGDETFEAGSSSDQVVAQINVAANGTFSVSSLQFPPIPPIDGPLGDINVTINLLSGSGAVNPLNGVASLNLSLRIDIDGGGTGSDCRISPVNIAAATTNSGGVPYNPSTGRVTLADHTFSVPGAQGCSTFPINVNNEINSQLGLPSGSGNNHAVFSGGFNPIRAAAIVPSFTATPSSGFAPLNVVFNAGATTSSKAVSSYAWDFTNNGSFDVTGPSPLAANTYVSPGVYTAKLRVTDTDGDLAETTRTITVLTPHADATLDKTGTATIIHGDPGSYTLSVGSEGELPVAGAQVVDTLPTGVVFTGFGGSGWSCTPAGQVITCDSADVVLPGDSFPDLTIDVLADGSFTGVVTNSATVSTGTEIDLSDNTDTADTLLVQPGIDLDIDKVHDADDGLFAGQRATYILSVGNDGTVTADGTVFVSDTLPAGTTLIGASGGLDWVCTYSAPTVSCFSNVDVAPGESLDDIRIRVELTSVTSPLENTATVTTTGDSNPSNDSATDSGEVLGFAVDYEIAKVHLAQIVVGEPTTYGIAVQNIGTQTGGGTVTVTDELPAGLTYVSGVGDGWTCGAAGQTVTCTHPGTVEAGDQMPGISLQVAVDSAALPSVTNTATVSGAGDVNAANDSASDEGSVRLPEPDLALSKSHVGNFTTGSNGSYTLSVRNVATERADGPTTVVDNVPAGLTYVGASGTGWACGNVGPQVTCTYPGTIAGLATAPPITLVAHAPDGAPDIVINGASVSNAGDDNPLNDSAFDPTRIDRRQQAPTSLEADAIVLKVKLGTGGITVLNAPYAVLTSNGVPVPGKLVTFRVLNQQQVICTAVTNAQGVASCVGDLLIYLQTLTSLRYTADFVGDVDFKAAHDEAAILHLFDLKLI